MLKDKANFLSQICDYQKQLAESGFDWPNALAVLDKVKEELYELYEAIENQESSARVAEEYGDLLLVALHLSNHLGVDPSETLIKAQQKLQYRYEKMRQYAKNHGLSTLDELNDAWDSVKKSEN